MSARWLVDRRLAERGVEHGFGSRTAALPPDAVCAAQVHGAVVAEARQGRAWPEEADAIVSVRGGPPVAVVTADCVPVLLAAPEGEVVAAVHAGWRGLAAGVVEAGVEAVLRRCPGGARPPVSARARPEAGRKRSLVAAVGPHIGVCCYEVDGPVVEALRRRFGDELEAALAPSRPDRTGHFLLDLGAVARRALLDAGLAAQDIGTEAARCTSCDPARFPSYRRDGPGAGRVLHYVRPAGAGARPGIGVDTGAGPT